MIDTRLRCEEEEQARQGTGTDWLERALAGTYKTSHPHPHPHHTHTPHTPHTPTRHPTRMEGRPGRLTAKKKKKRTKCGRPARLIKEREGGPKPAEEFLPEPGECGSEDLQAIHVARLDWGQTPRLWVGQQGGVSELQVQSRGRGGWAAAFTGCQPAWTSQMADQVLMEGQLPRTRGVDNGRRLKRKSLARTRGVALVHGQDKFSLSSPNRHNQRVEGENRLIKAQKRGRS